MMFKEVLRRSFVLGQLSSLKTQLESLSEKRANRDIFSVRTELSADEIKTAMDALSGAEARESQRSSDKPQVARSGRRSPYGESSLDEVSFFSRDPIISIVQSSLEEHFSARTELIRDSFARDSAAPDDIPVTNRSISPALRLIGPFQPGDPGWLGVAVAKGISLYKRKHEFVTRPVSVTIPDESRVILVGDWGTGLPRAQKIANQIRKILSDGQSAQVIHLGDVYYAGFDWEYRSRFLKYWPVSVDDAGRVGSWSLNGNHDMYTGGHGYYEVLLKDNRFRRQGQCSYFQLSNAHWNIVGLDTAWADADLIDRHGVLHEQQLEWIKSIVENGKKNVFLSHHQLFSTSDKDTLRVGPELRSLLDSKRVNAWFWGHEHKCMFFKPHEGVELPRCMGNGGVPVYLDTSDVSDPATFEFKKFLPDGLEKWTLFAFAVLDFDGARLRVSYRDENGAIFGTEDYVAGIGGVPVGIGTSGKAQEGILRRTIPPGSGYPLNSSAGDQSYPLEPLTSLDYGSTHDASPMSPLYEDDKTTSVKRVPLIELSEEPIPNEIVNVFVGLKRPGPDADGEEMIISGLDVDWTNLPIRVRVSSADIDLENDEGEVDRAQPR